MVKLGTNTHQLAFNVLRSLEGGPFNQPDDVMLERLIPHLNRSFLVGIRTTSLAFQPEAEYRSLDRLTNAVILLDGGNKVVFMNQAAVILTSGSTLGVRRRELVASHPIQQRQFNLAIAAVSSGEPSHAFKLQKPSERSHLNVIITSVRGKDLDRFADSGWRGVKTMIFVTEPTRSPRVSLKRLMEVYGLTLSEARVALLSGGGGLPKEIADHLEVSTDTVKTHLRRIYNKCDVRGQVELIRLIASLELIL